MTDFRKLLDEAVGLSDRDRTQMAGALIASLKDEIIEVDLAPEERSLLRIGLNQWGGPGQCTEELAFAMGFFGTEHLADEVYDRLLPALEAQKPLSRFDWLRVLLATEIVFASDVLGAGGEWHIVAGLSDEDTLRLLRRVQQKLGREVRWLIGHGFGTRRTRSSRTRGARRRAARAEDDPEQP